MKYLILFSTFLTSALLAPVNNEYKILVSQDASGNYKITYSLPNFYKIEERHYDGTLFGIYYYVDTSGSPQTISYIAGEDGLKLTSSTVNALLQSDEQQPDDVKQKRLEEVRQAIDELEQKLSDIRPLAPFTPELVKITIDHLKAVEIAKVAAKKNGFVKCAPTPEPTTESPEMQAAKVRQLNQFLRLAGVVQ